VLEAVSVSIEARFVAVVCVVMVIPFSSCELVNTYRGAMVGTPGCMDST
jgi:hypothetical protein